MLIDLAPLAPLRDRIRAQARSTGKEKPWYRIQNAANDPDATDIYIYDEISWWGISADQFSRELREVTTKTINLHLNSPGGDVFDGIAIHNVLRYHPARVIARVEGIAASIASVIAMAGDEVVMAPHSMMMIHDAWGVAIGNAGEMRDTADILDKLSENLADIYREQAGGKLSQWRNKMLEETWYSDQEAVDAGLADRIDDGAEPAKAKFDLSRFNHAPAALCTGAQGDCDADERQPTKRELETVLRDAGLSRSDARAFVARGWVDEATDEEQRDAVTEAETVIETAASTDEPAAEEESAGMADEYPRDLAAAKLRLARLMAA